MRAVCFVRASLILLLASAAVVADAPQRGSAKSPGDMVRWTTQKSFKPGDVMRADVNLDSAVAMAGADVASRAALAADRANPSQPAAPDFGPNVLIFDPSMTNIQDQIDAVFKKQERN